MFSGLVSKLTESRKGGLPLKGGTHGYTSNAQSFKFYILKPILVTITFQKGAGHRCKILVTTDEVYNLVNCLHHGMYIAEFTQTWYTCVINLPV